MTSDAARVYDFDSHLGDRNASYAPVDFRRTHRHRPEIEARFVARVIRNAGKNKPRGAFSYFDKGTMATIGRSRAVAEAKGVKMSGLLAWLAWLFVHLWFLIGFRNRVAVMLTWIWSYITYGRGARLITGRVGD